MEWRPVHAKTVTRNSHGGKLIPFVHSDSSQINHSSRALAQLVFPVCSVTAFFNQFLDVSEVLLHRARSSARISASSSGCREAAARSHSFRARSSAFMSHLFVNGLQLATQSGNTGGAHLVPRLRLSCPTALGSGMVRPSLEFLQLRNFRDYFCAY